MLPQMRVHETRYPHIEMANVSQDTKAVRAETHERTRADGERSEGPGAAALTIAQPAAEVGMSVRNIRNHHSRGLLPAPEVRARVGYYGAEHVARLQPLPDLQRGGLK